MAHRWPRWPTKIRTRPESFQYNIPMPRPVGLVDIQDLEDEEEFIEKGKGSNTAAALLGRKSPKSKPYTKIFLVQVANSCRFWENFEK